MPFAMESTGLMCGTEQGALERWIFSIKIGQFRAHWTFFAPCFIRSRSDRRRRFSHILQMDQSSFHEIGFLSRRRVMIPNTVPTRSNFFNGLMFCIVRVALRTGLVSQFAVRIR